MKPVQGKKVTVLGLILIGVLIGCSRGGWESQIAENFLNSCMARGRDKQFCSCELNKVQAKYSQSELSEIEREILQTGRLPDDYARTVVAAVAECPP